MDAQALIPALAGLVALASLLYTMLRDKGGSVSASQAIRDKLDYISDTTRDTREDVRALDRKLDDHASRIARVEAEVEAHEKRIEHIEQKEN